MTETLHPQNKEIFPLSGKISRSHRKFGPVVGVDIAKCYDLAIRPGSRARELRRQSRCVRLTGEQPEVFKTGSPH